MDNVAMEMEHLHKQTRLVGAPDALKGACPVRGTLGGNLPSVMRERRRPSIPSKRGRRNLATIATSGNAIIMLHQLGHAAGGIPHKPHRSLVTSVAACDHILRFLGAGLRSHMAPSSHSRGCASI